MDQTPELTLVIAEQTKEQQIQPETGQELLTAYKPFFDQAYELVDQARRINITDASQLDEIAQARTVRLALVKVRTSMDKLRKSLKEESMRKSRAVDGVANVLKYIVEPIEEALLEQEKIAERIQAERRAKLKSERETLLAGVCDDTSVYILEAMDQEDFDQLLENLTARKEARIAAEAKAEADRLAKEKAEREEQERIKAENERLRLENERIERERRAEQEAAEAQRKALEAAAEKERVAAQAKLDAERAEAQRKADEAAAAAQAEQDRLNAEAEAERAEAARILAAERKAALERETELAAQAEAKRREVEKQQEIERKEQEEVARQEREAREKAEAELQAQRDAETARLAEVEAEKAREAQSSDREKLEKFADALQVRIASSLFLPLTSEKGQIVAETVRVKLSDVVRYVNSQLPNL